MSQSEMRDVDELIAWCDQRRFDAECGYHTRKSMGMPSLSWVVAGGESGPKARPSHPDWVRSLRDQCLAAGVPFLFKQWGTWVECVTEVNADEIGRAVYPREDSIFQCLRDRRYATIEAHGTEFMKVGKKAAGRMLDGQIHDEYPA